MFRRNALLAVALLAAGFLLWYILSASGVPILAYHRISDDNELYSVSPAEFERQMQYLAEHGYTAISLGDMFDGFAGKRQMPAKPVVITFDDGYEDNYLTALPILEKYGFRATVFIIAGQVGQEPYLTWEQIRSLLRHNVEIGSHTFSHATLTEIPVEAQREELIRSKELLEQNLDRPVRFIAYPFGKYSASLFPLLAEAGYRGACTGVAGLNYNQTNRYALKRISIPRPRYGLWEFRARLLRADMVYRLGK